MKKLAGVLLAFVLLFSCALPALAAPPPAEAPYETTTLAAIRATRVTLNKKAFTLTAKGRAAQLRAVVAPSKASQKVAWRSSNKNIVAVSSQGKIVAKATKGRAIITAQAKDGSGKKASCVVYIGKRVTGVSLKASTTSVAVGRSIRLTATVTPSNSANKNVGWKSSNPSVAEVTSTGVVKGISAGKARITVTTQDGGKAVYRTITVKKIATQVWIPKSGSKYHSTSTCSNMKNPSRVSLAEAKNRGYTACSKCW